MSRASGPGVPVTLVCLCALASPSGAAQGEGSERAGTSTGAVSVLLDRATAYVERFYRDFGSMVAEERYEQRMRPIPGSNTRFALSGRDRTTLVSDFLLVEIPGQGWVPFRDVFEHDGKPVPDRQTRLADLFLSGAQDAWEQGLAVINESARYNIGNVERNINVPTLALAFLMRGSRDRFEFEVEGRDADAVVMTYEEKDRPTIVQNGQGGDLPVEGQFWLDEEDGTVLRTELRAIDTGAEAKIIVTYRYDPDVRSWVPARMEERYVRRRDRVEVLGEATYARFRRFQVETAERFEQ